MVPPHRGRSDSVPSYRPLHHRRRQNRCLRRRRRLPRSHQLPEPPPCPDLPAPPAPGDQLVGGIKVPLVSHFWPSPKPPTPLVPLPPGPLPAPPLRSWLPPPPPGPPPSLPAADSPSACPPAPPASGSSSSSLLPPPPPPPPIRRTFLFDGSGTSVICSSVNELSAVLINRVEDPPLLSNIFSPARPRPFPA